MIELNETLLEAASKDDVAAIKRLLKAGVNIEARGQDERTPLHRAAENNCLDAARLLLKRGADIDSLAYGEVTPILDAVAFGHDAMVELLLDAGADPAITDDSDWNLLHWAVNENNLSTARLLMDRCHFLVNTTRSNGLSPLYFAADEGNLEMVKLLVRHGALITQLDDYDDTPISIAEKNGHTLVAEHLRSKLIYRQERTQSKFFDDRRSKSKQTHALVKEYLNFRRSPTKDAKKRPLEATHIPGRRLVTGDAGALRKSLVGLDENTAITPEAMARNGGWYNGGLAKGKKVNANWGRECIHYQLDIDPRARGKKKKAEEVTIVSQYKPLVGHRGNFFMAGIGKYGTSDKNHILSVINEATRVEPVDLTQQAENEKRLANLFLEFVRRGAPITTGVLQKQGFHVPPIKKDRVKQLHYLNRVCYLTAVKEVSRRMYPGAKTDGSAVEELPIGLAYVMALRLVADGHLRMKNVFDADAPYGLPTATSISDIRGIARAKNKLVKLNDLFYKTYPDSESSREGMHQLLLAGYAGESDTSGDEYNTSDEEKPAGRAAK
jgi:ankyrin repeat protein